MGHPAVFVAIWIALSAIVILFNAYIFKELQFTYPIALVMFHMGACNESGEVAVFGLQPTGGLSSPRPREKSLFAMVDVVQSVAYNVYILYAGDFTIEKYG